MEEALLVIVEPWIPRWSWTRRGYGLVVIGAGGLPVVVVVGGNSLLKGSQRVAARVVISFPGRHDLMAARVSLESM